MLDEVRVGSGGDVTQRGALIRGVVRAYCRAQFSLAYEWKTLARIPRGRRPPRQIDGRFLYSLAVHVVPAQSPFVPRDHVLADLATDDLPPFFVTLILSGAHPCTI
jgi:hypothetical protein